MKYLLRSEGMSWGGIFGDATTTVFVYNTGRKCSFSFWLSRKIKHVKKVHLDERLTSFSLHVNSKG